MRESSDARLMLAVGMRSCVVERRGEGEPELDRWSASSHLRALCVHGANAQAD